MWLVWVDGLEEIFLKDPRMGLSGLEPPTSRLSGVRSNRLSYKPIGLQQLAAGFLDVSRRSGVKLFLRSTGFPATVLYMEDLGFIRGRSRRSRALRARSRIFFEYPPG